MPSFDPLRIPEPPDPISKLVEELIVLGAVLAFQLGTYTEHRAAELFLSIKTVETHVSNVLRKLQLSNRHELTAWALSRRLL